MKCTSWSFFARPFNLQDMGIEMLNMTNLLLENIIDASVAEHVPQISGLYLSTQADCSLHRQWVLPYLVLQGSCGDRRTKIWVLFWVRSAESAQPGTEGPAHSPVCLPTHSLPYQGCSAGAAWCSLTPQGTPGIFNPCNNLKALLLCLLLVIHAQKSGLCY